MTHICASGPTAAGLALSGEEGRKEGRKEGKKEREEGRVRVCVCVCLPSTRICIYALYMCAALEKHVLAIILKCVENDLTSLARWLAGWLCLPIHRSAGGGVILHRWALASSSEW